MTLDLDELARDATAAKDVVESWQILPPPTWVNGRCAPSMVLALIARIRALEAVEKIPTLGAVYSEPITMGGE